MNKNSEHIKNALLSLTKKDITDFFINIKEFVNSGISKISKPLTEFEDSPFLYHIGQYYISSRPINLDIYIYRYSYLINHIKVVWFQAYKENNMYAKDLFLTLKKEIKNFLEHFYKLAELVQITTMVSFKDDCYAVA